MVAFLIPLLSGIFMGTFLAAFLPLRHPQEFQQQYPHRSYTITTLFVALIGGLTTGAVWTVGSYLFDRTITWDGAFIGIGWSIGILTTVFVKLKRVRRT